MSAPVAVEPVDVVAAVLIAVLALASVPYARWAARRRRELDAWAERHGWLHQPRRPQTLPMTWVAPGWSHGTASDVLEGYAGETEVTSFTFRGPVSLRRLDGARHVVLVTMPVIFPSLSIEPEDDVARAEIAAGGQDLRFESEAFNRAWRVRSTSREFAHAVVHPRLMARLLRPDVADVGVVVEDGHVLVHRPGPTDLARVLQLADLAAEVAASLPGFVRHDAAQRHASLPPTRRARRLAIAAVVRQRGRGGPGRA